mgnify:CR=1 FL=1
MLCKKKYQINIRSIMFAKHYTLCSRSQPNEMEKIRKAVSILVPKMQKKSVNH